MNDEIFLMIDSYIDGELSRNDEDILFEQLALNSDARDYFRKVNLIRNQTECLTKEFPVMLEKKIISGVQRNSLQRYSYSARFTGIVAAGISIFLLAITFFLLNQVADYRNEIRSAVNQMRKQSTIIEALYNSFPPTEVHAQYSNEIIIKPKI